MRVDGQILMHAWRCCSVCPFRCDAYDPWKEGFQECEFDKRVNKGIVDTSGIEDAKVST